MGMEDRVKRRLVKICILMTSMGLGSGASRPRRTYRTFQAPAGRNIASDIQMIANDNNISLTSLDIDNISSISDDYDYEINNHD